MTKPPLLIGISYCGAHNKGDEAWSDQAIRVTPAEHAEWLNASVDFYLRWAANLDRPARVVVTAVGLPSIMEINADGERNWMWEVQKKVAVLSYPKNPGHQVGACMGLRLGLEAAGCWHFPYYMHTAEDVLPWPGSFEKLLEALDQENDYAGFVWSECLNCQTFACRTTALAGTFDYEAVKQHVGFEHYLSHLLKDRPVHLVNGQGYYVTTHDWKQYRSWLKQMPDSTNPKVVRVMSDYDANWGHFG